MRLLLDEMLSGAVAGQLRGRGHDVVAVQDHRLSHLRGIDDCALLDHATTHRRAVVTDNIPDFLRCHRARVELGRTHFGLLLFTNDTFPRHRHDAFVGRAVTAIDSELADHPVDDDSRLDPLARQPSLTRRCPARLLARRSHPSAGPKPPIGRRAGGNTWTDPPIVNPRP